MKTDRRAASSRLNAIAAMAAMALALPFGALCANPGVPAGDVVIAQWNVENLYDTKDDPGTSGDDAFTPSGWTRWTEYRYRLKLTNIAEVVSAMKPDILCVEEVENREVLADLQEVLANAFGWPMKHIVHKNSSDPRALDCAMLSRIRPVRTKWLHAFKGLHISPCVEFDIDGASLVVIGNHWKSRVGNTKISDAKREVQADRIREEYQSRLKVDPALAIVVAGDFNDDMEDRIPHDVALFRTNMAEVVEAGDSLFCMSALLPPERRSTYFYNGNQNKSWHTFDTMNVSRGLLPDAVPASPWVADFDSYRVHADDRMRMGELEIPFPARRNTHGESPTYYYGYSDHFPLVLRLKRRGQ